MDKVYLWKARKGLSEFTLLLICSLSLFDSYFMSLTMRREFACCSLWWAPVVYLLEALLNSWVSETERAGHAGKNVWPPFVLNCNLPASIPGPTQLSVTCSTEKSLGTRLAIYYCSRLHTGSFICTVLLSSQGVMVPRSSALKELGETHGSLELIPGMYDQSPG